MRRAMPATAKLFLAIGAIAMLWAVALGAFGAHGLKSQIAPDLLAVYRTAVEYHFYHALGLLAVGLVAQRLPASGTYSFPLPPEAGRGQGEALDAFRQRVVHAVH